MDLRHGPADRLLDGAAVHPFSGDNIGDYLRINGSLENRPPVLQLPADFMSVCQVTVMGDGQGPLDIPHHQRLGVFRHTVAGGRIPHMADAHLPGKLVQILGMKHLADQSHILMIGNYAPVVHSDAAAFLSTVLQG